MKGKTVIIAIAAVLVIGLIPTAYMAGRYDGINRSAATNQEIYNGNGNYNYNYRGNMMGGHRFGYNQNTDYAAMIKLLKDNGFTEITSAMEKEDYQTARTLIGKLSDADYRKLVDLMQKKGYYNFGHRMMWR